MHQAAAATVGITLALCYVAVSRARGESSPSRARRRSPGIRESEGFVDLIRDECELLRKQEVVQPSLSRMQLTAGRLVVVIIGPTSTGVHQVREFEPLARRDRKSGFDLSFAHESARPYSVRFMMVKLHIETVSRTRSMRVGMHACVFAAVDKRVRVTGILGSWGRPFSSFWGGGYSTITL